MHNAAQHRGLPTLHSGKSSETRRVSDYSGGCGDRNAILLSNRIDIDLPGVLITDKSSIYRALDECVVSLSTELGAVGAVKAEVGRGGRDGARLPAVAAVAAAAARAR